MHVLAPISVWLSRTSSRSSRAVAYILSPGSRISPQGDQHSALTFSRRMKFSTANVSFNSASSSDERGRALLASSSRRRRSCAAWDGRNASICSGVGVEVRTSSTSFHTSNIFTATATLPLGPLCHYCHFDTPRLKRGGFLLPPDLGRDCQRRRHRRSYALSTSI